MFIGDELVDKVVKKVVVRGSCQVLYVSPESYLTVQCWRDMLASLVYASNFVALVVDEAHCIDTWLCAEIEPAPRLPVKVLVLVF